MRLHLLCALLLSTSAVSAQKVVIYRCTDARGALTLQNAVPCPKGSQQDKRVIDAAPPATASRQAAVTRTAPPARAVPAAIGPTTAPPPTISSASAIDVADRLPPPALFECRTYDKDRYLSDDGNPPQRCAPLTTTGIGAGSAAGAGESCQMVSDQCQRIADGALCENWKARLLEVQASVRFGRQENQASAQAEVERIGRIVRDSTCGR